MYYLKCRINDNPNKKGHETLTVKLIADELSLPSASGGFQFVNMYNISHFNNVQMANLLGKDGGCIYVGLDREFYQQMSTYSNYKFTNLSLTISTRKKRMKLKESQNTLLKLKNSTRRPKRSMLRMFTPSF